MADNPTRSILIVEDERIVALDLQQTLTELGYGPATIVASSADALDHAAQRPPDLVLMDIRIDGPVDGIETADLLRAKFDIPVVYLTAHADDGTLSRAKATEPYGYLIKPVTAADLRSAVEITLTRHRAEARLRERERWFATTLSSIADAVVTMDLDRRVTYLNPAAERLTGVPLASALHRPVKEVLRLDEGGVPLEELPIEAALRTVGTVKWAEGRVTNVASGDARVIADAAAPVFDQRSNRVLGAVMVFRDVTDERQLYRRMERADRLASLGTMAAGLAHEINNPLSVILGNAEFATDALRDLRHQSTTASADRHAVPLPFDDIGEALGDVQAAAQRIERIVSDMRAFTRPAQNGRGSADVIRSLEWALRTTSFEFRRRARVTRHLDSVPPVVGDEARLGQVFINLLVNAAHAIPEGNPERHEVSVTASRDGDDTVLVAVRDTGEGIAPEVMDRIFEPFFTTKPLGQGTGLGLSISYGIVRALGGDLHIDSTLGAGTTVHVRLPVARLGDDLAATAPADAPVPSPRRGRVLLVDDEPMLLHALGRALRDHEVTTARSVRDALALIDRGQPFDVIVTDLMMPELSGVDFHQQLQRRASALAGRMIFLSAGALTPRARAFIDEVPNPRLQKPVDPATLLAAVNAVLVDAEPRA